jgi:hypothetical protein
MKMNDMNVNFFMKFTVLLFTSEIIFEYLIHIHLLHKNNELFKNYFAKNLSEKKKPVIKSVILHLINHHMNHLIY